jgi:hypothetical protein
MLLCSRREKSRVAASHPFYAHQPILDKNCCVKTFAFSRIDVGRDPGDLVATTASAVVPLRVLLRTGMNLEKDHVV